MRALRFSWTQFNIFAERYLDVCCAQWASLLLLLLQAPIIGVCILLVWRDVAQATDTTYFVLGLSAIWFGAINASRELVKERAVFLRELDIGLEIGSYVFAKFLVLALLGCLQCLALVLIVNSGVPLLGGLVWHYLILVATSWAGTGLGLAISAASSSPDQAVAMVPIFLLPQILFSEMVLTSEYASTLTKRLQELTISLWSYSAQRELVAAEPLWQTVLKDFGVLGLMSMALVLIAVWLLYLGRRK